MASQRTPVAPEVVFLILPALAAGIAAQELRTLDSPGVMAATYDSARNRGVAIGLYGETLEFDGISWRTRPVPRLEFSNTSFARLAFVAATGQTLMLHAPSQQAGHFEVSSFDGVAWQHDLPFPAPLTRDYFALAYDDARGELVLFGGYNQPFGALSDTWVFDGSAWSQRSPAVAPSARVNAAAIYDSSRSRIVLFGGGLSSTHYNDTWEWDGTSWTQMVPAASPSPRSSAAMTFDSLRHRTVLFGGRNVTVGTYADTWEYDGVTWVAPQTPAGAPAPRDLATFVFDDNVGEAVLTGGHGVNFTHHDTWSWNGTRWLSLTSPIEPRSPHAAVAAVTFPGNDIVIVDYQNQTPASWVWDGAQWSAVSGTIPVARHSHVMTTGPSYVYLYGGQFWTTSLDDLWGFNGSSWAMLSNNGPVSSGMTIAHDWARNELVLFGGRAGITPLSDTWVWNGTAWQQRTPATVPPARARSAMAYDIARQKTVLFGGLDVSNSRLRDTWEWDGIDWAQVVTATRPPEGQATMAFDSGVGAITLLVEAGLHVDGRRWTFDGVDWTGHTLQGIPAKAYDNISLVAAPGGAGLRMVDDRHVYSLDVGHAQVAHYGAACTANALDLAAVTWPRIDTPGFGIDVVSGPGSSLVALLGAINAASVNIAGCTQLVQPGQATVLLGTSPTGFVTGQLPIPNNPTFLGADLFFQAAALDPTAPNGFTMSRGLQVTIGT